MEYAITNMDDSSKGELFYRSLVDILDSLSQGKLVFFPPVGSGHASALKPVNFFYPPESHDVIEMTFCLKNRVHFYVNGFRHTFRSGSLNVFLPGDVHTERFYRANLGYRVFWVQVMSEYLGFQITCFEPNRGYSLLGKQMSLNLESRESLLALGTKPELRSDKLAQMRFQCKLMDVLLESLPLIRRIPDQQKAHIPFSCYLVEQLKHYLDSHFHETLSLPKLAGIFHYSPSHLNMLFRKRFGVPILKYILHRRIDLAERLLQTTDQEIKRISFLAGFRDPLYFSRVFRRIKGRAPSEYRQ